MTQGASRVDSKPQDTASTTPGEEVKHTENRASQAALVDPVFPRFFKNGDEQPPKLIGLIAYGIYEEARREWVDAFKRREGRYPAPDELHVYQTSWTSSRLEGLNNAAVQLLARYADSISREVENQALRGALRGGFLSGVVLWLFSAVIFVAAVLTMIVALSRAGVDPVYTYRALLRPADSSARPRADSIHLTPTPPPSPTAAAPTPPPAAEVPATPEPPAATSPSSTNAPAPPARRSGR